jgi:radical SAM protein with 4Fe4S-binding SPASM domain
MFGWNEELDISSFKKTPMKEWPICKSPWRQLGINADGTTRACVFDYDSRYVIGNARDDDALQLWNNERMAEFRKALIERRYEDVEEEGLPLCTECSQLWPTSPLADTTQLPNDFQKEVEAVFKSEQYGFMATKYLDPGVKKEKLQYLKQHRDEWLKMVMADVV